MLRTRRAPVNGEASAWPRPCPLAPAMRHDPRARRPAARRGCFGLAALALAAGLPARTAGQDAAVPPAARAAAERIRAERIRSDVAYLASDALRGRNTPSPGLDSAAAFIARRLERAGVRPLGDGGGYLQWYDLRETAPDTAGAYLEVDGRRFRFGTDFLLRSFPGPLDATAPVVYVGHGVRAPARGIDPYAGLDIKGKILLAHGPLAMPRGVSPQLRGRIGADLRAPWTEAFERGALAVLFIPLPRQLEAWDRLPRAPRSTLELDPPAPSAYAAIPVPTLALRRAVVEALLDGEQVSGRELLQLGDSANFPPSFELRRRITVHLPAAVERRHRAANVVAWLEGSDPTLRNEYITLAAHLDGAVGPPPAEGDSVYNAADDNASGSAALLAIAEALAQGPRPRRSLIFLWDSGEERGLWGTRRFVSRPPVPLERVVAHINVDMIGGTRRPGTAVQGEEELAGPGEVYVIGPRVLSTELDSLVERAGRAFGLRLDRRYDTVESEFFYPRTDSGPFLERGVPAVQFFTGLHPRYHRPDDEAQYLDPQKMETVARTVLATAWLLADAPARPTLDKGIPPSVPRYR